MNPPITEQPAAQPSALTPAVPAPPRDLDGRVAVVTGGLSGIGAAIADHLALRGAHVVVGDVTGPATPTELTRATAHGEVTVLAVRCDVRSEEDVEALIGHGVARTPEGGLHVLVNCAGISRKSTITEITVDDWTAVLDTNLRGAVLGVKHAARVMTAQGSGSIINIASIAGLATLDAQNTAYVATKGALIALTKSLVYELAPHGVRINCVAPGLVETPILANMTQEWRDLRTARIPTGRMGETEEIAATVGFLASDASTYTHGQTLVVDGGLTSVSFLPPVAPAQPLAAESAEENAR